MWYWKGNIKGEDNLARGLAAVAINVVWVFGHSLWVSSKPQALYHGCLDAS